ncbi:MAG: 6-phosphofructo-2-kinase/fructose-2,6-bisphosphatase [Deltaproteobacteria bacterium]
MEKLLIVMMGLPARGKSTMARKIARTLELDEVPVRVFNNGELRRQLLGEESSSPDFFSPENEKGVASREQIARMNMDRALDFLVDSGRVAIIDASNVSRKRRQFIEEMFAEFPVLFIECANADAEALEANLERKAVLKEFRHLSAQEALDGFTKRIELYEKAYEPLEQEKNRILVDSFDSCILQEKVADLIPYYDRIRDILTTRIVRNLFLLRHGETVFNVEDRIGGDSDLTEKGRAQAETMAGYFAPWRIPAIFISNHRRTQQTARPIAEKQEHCPIIALPEFNEIDAGLCDGMTYREIREKMPWVAEARKRDKYGYVYPEGEGYCSMEKRVHRGMKKVFYLNNLDDNIMIVGHQAVNRMILSYFLSRPNEEVPFIYMPQDRYYHIQIDPYKRIFELLPYTHTPR